MLASLAAVVSRGGPWSPTAAAQPSRLGHHGPHAHASGMACPARSSPWPYVPLVWSTTGSTTPGAGDHLLIHRHAAGLVFAYIVRFHALALFDRPSSAWADQPQFDDAACSLGADRSRLLADVHLPLLGPGVANGALPVLVEVMKELPATALLRPLGRDTSRS